VFVQRQPWFVCGVVKRRIERQFAVTSVCSVTFLLAKVGDSQTNQRRSSFSALLLWPCHPCIPCFEGFSFAIRLSFLVFFVNFFALLVIPAILMIRRSAKYGNAVIRYCRNTGTTFSRPFPCRLSLNLSRAKDCMRSARLVLNPTSRGSIRFFLNDQVSDSSSDSYTQIEDASPCFPRCGCNL
jgi:hypothetical protein